MTKKIDTLAKDIKQLFTDAQGGNGTLLGEEVLARFGTGVALQVNRSLRSREEGKRKPNTLYVSEIGTPCHRKVYYNHNLPHMAEPVQGHSQFKFLYGDLLEETSLLLAEAAGHKVERRQEQVEYPFLSQEGQLWHIRGRMDVVIDGVLVDVKSASSYSYKKFQEGLDDYNDSFGYRAQLSTYNDLTVPRFKEQGFLAIDKQNGHIGYFPSAYQPTGATARKVIQMLEAGKEPKRHYTLVPDGKSGNEKLGIECSYCPFKQHCWRDANGGAGLKAYSYSYGPVFLGTIHHTPRVPEMVMPTIPAAHLTKTRPAKATKVLRDERVHTLS